MPLNADWLADGLAVPLLLTLMQRLSSTSALRINLCLQKTLEICKEVEQDQRLPN